ncbi:histone-lysine N-methyltransferase trithorax [Asbolus verrucosus]|uniref:Histone-lysine N-methyltransferase trithorax n=1 Tax=Asbolus verrucosus TaxID=1661398 RepID=A0A482W5Z5_ASBVE|nr:histone-lysine N-methyltransferase trithorax [Asbolus verrucosus]
MGRSKFPGKPAKHVNRKRINVLPPTTEGIIHCTRFMRVETVAENKQVNDTAQGADEGVNLNGSTGTKVSLKKRLDRKMQTSKALHSNNSSKRSLMSKLCGKNSVKAVTNKAAVKAKLNCKPSRKASISRKSVRGCSAVNNFKQCRNGLPKESNNLVGKFVLPTRSVHSSRVIKPNKRFINVDLSDTLTLKKRVVNKRHCLKEDESQSKNYLSDSDRTLLSSTSTKTFSNGRVVLRQARLKLHNQTPTGSEGPFSSNSVNGSPPGTVTCGVCGAVRFYRFVKQARKFNIYSCESCRKFISKMIKRQTCGKNISSSTLVCHKGQGMCHVPPIVRSQQMKLIRCAYRSRCPACWLKMCLRSFQMPMSLKHSLVQLLPKNMQGSDVIFNNSLPLLWQVNVQNVENRLNKLPGNVQTETLKRPVRFKNTKPVPPANAVSINSDVKRQKIDLKGPRVKHVCRSASIVLGQPVATFPAEAEVKKNESRDHSPDTEQSQADKPNNIVACYVNSEVKEIPQVMRSSKDVNCSENELSDNDKFLKLPLILNDTLISQIKGDKSHRNKLNPGKKQNSQEIANMVSTDYWGNCDVEDVAQNGFCLIASQQFPMPAICFLCGSAGREALLYCSLCCEPYHLYCLEQNPPVSTNSKQFLWLCPRCTTCSVCNQTDRQKLNCRKCWKAYHSECFNTKWTGADKPVQMMECTKCNKWVHAKCEGLSEEYYHALSILPESVKFLCNLCSKQSIPNWRKAVETELKFNFRRILSMLSKNKIAKTMLKLNPLTNQDLLSKTITSVKKIALTGDDNDDDNHDSSSTYLYHHQNKNNDESDKNVISDGSTQLKNYSECRINQPKILTVLDIKNKLIWNEYDSVKDFNKEMEEALGHINSDELLNTYRLIFKSVFPWFKSSQTDEDIKSKSTSKTRIFSSTDDDVCDQIECVAIDSRYCSFCKSIGDGLSHLESRLLYCGQNEWVHINCAFWSSEVYEEIDGSLQNVHSALSRGRIMRCSYCKQKGATVDCCFKNCCETYHFICARTAKCHFTHDKTVYCCSHELPKNISVIVTPTDFNIRRTVFVEMSDNKKGNFSQIEKVNVMVGSLCVTNIGKINPLISDSVDAIIPTGYNCSRLFWSTVEPWKLVSYKISTSVLNAHMNNLHVDKNFTVDHTLPKSVVERKLKEILIWHKDIDKKKSDIVEMEDEEEPQNGADLLSPEITDAILEELPHELLDGISVQDIFPKLMSYEDLINMDCKSETNSCDVISVNNDVKKLDQDENIGDFDAKEAKNKYDIIPEIVTKNKNQQKSCSLTVSCKLDNSFSPVMKKRKITPRENSVFFKLLQVDGNFDDSSSDCGSPTGTYQSDIWDSNLSEEPVTCERCHCTYRTQASYKRHLNACEVICTSESDSELNQDQDINTNMEASSPQLNIIESSNLVTESQQPVIVTAYESYQNQIHTSVLNTETFVTSKSTSELIAVPQKSDIIIPQVSHTTEEKSDVSCNLATLTNQPPLTESVSNETFTVSQSMLSVQEPVSIATNEPAQFCLNSAVPLCVNPPITFQPNATISVNPTASIINTSTPIINQTIAINQTCPLSVNQTTVQSPLQFQPSSVTIQSLPYSSNVAPIVNVAPQSQITFTDKLLNNSNIINSVIAQGIPANRWIKSVEKPTVFPAKKCNRGRGRSIAAKRSYVALEDNETVVIPPTNSTAPSMIMQQLPSASFIPTFVDTFQQQSGQNLQYVATISPQINSTIHPQPLVQFQAENNLISLLPGLQPTMIIQQPRVLENQLVLDSSGSLSWTPQVQPVYYGFETIVQNTVMQSQQFLPSTVPGVLTANSSYSTTTQVFQTSKLEPVLDMGANSFVLVNPGQLVTSQSIEISQNAQSQPINTLTNVLQNTEISPCKYASTSFQKLDHHTTSVNTNSITLPTAPFISEQGIPTNIVTPTPKSLTTTQSRPMNRVLPMQTLKESNKIKIHADKNDTFRKEVKTVNKNIESLAEFEEKMPAESVMKNSVQIHLQNECLSIGKKVSPLKLVFQKQSEDGSYKISNNFIEKPLHFTNQNVVTKANNFNNCKQSLESAYKINNNFNNRNSPVQIAPLKPIKSNFNQSKPVHILSLSDKQNRQEKVEKKISLETKHYPHEKKENENMPSILYTIETQDGFKYSSTSITDLWTKVFEAVQNARAAHNMPLLPQDSNNVMNSLKILGLKTSGLKYLIEQLPGATKCTKYRPSFNFLAKNAEFEDELIGHTSGCARCAPHIKKNEPYDMFRWLASKHRKPEHSLFCSDLIPR